MRSVRTSLFSIVAILVGVGVVMIYSASAIYAYSNMNDSLYYLKRHLTYLGIGLVLMSIAMSLDLKRVKSLAKPLLFTSVILLVLVLIPHVGKEISGAKRWFKLGLVNFQPSEFAKIAILIYMADFISRKRNLVKSFIHGYIPAMIVLGAVVGLILLEPDLGTAVTISVVTIMMLYASGLKVSYIVASLLASLPLLYALLFRVPFRRKRLMTFLNPWADKQGTGFQIIQSFIALGSGGLFGVGLGQSRQKLFYLPASYTDFIFSIIGEELGLLGTASIVVLFILFVWEGMKVVMRTTGIFEKMLSFGIILTIALEAIINIGVTAGALPTKGLPLPFISYGGSGLIFHLMAVGLLLNVAKTCETVR
ncbi:MAG: putative lipid II flippase FtsW [Candidatus Omnitrophota bacterium]